MGEIQSSPLDLWLNHPHLCTWHLHASNRCYRRFNFLPLVVFLTVLFMPLLSTILIISIIVAMSRVKMTSGINEVMIAPFTKIIKTPALAYWTIGLLMMFISRFFWPITGCCTFRGCFVTCCSTCRLTSTWGIECQQRHLIKYLKPILFS